MAKRALITGIEGFTGPYMAAELQAAGYEVFGLSHQPMSKSPAGVAGVYACELDNGAGLVEIIADVRPDAVVHLAAISTVTFVDVDRIYQTNLLGARRILECLSQAGCGQDGVLLASSANVYGNTRAGIVDETTPPMPANDYAVSKLGMEHVARLFTDRLPIVIARAFNYTGVGQSETFLLPKLIAHARRGEYSVELGNLDIARDFSDVRVVVQYYRRLLQSQSARAGVFNVCSGRAHTLREVLKMVETISGHPFEVRINPALIRENEVRHLEGSRQRLIATVGEVPDVPLRDTLSWMFGAAA